jgi:hypothetical protein
MNEESRTKRREPVVNRLFAAIVAAYLLLYGILLILDYLHISVKMPLVLGLTAGELTLLVPTVMYLFFTRTKPKNASERWRLPLGAVPLLILLAYCILPLISLVNLVSMLIGRENAAASLLVPMKQLPLWLSLLCVSVLPGVLEEFIFRGLIYGSYRRRRVWGAIFVSALLFGLMHMNLNQFCYAFVMGVMFCLLYEGTGSLLASMLVHAVYNGNSVILMYWMDTSELMEAVGGASAEGMQQMAAGGVSMLMTVLMLSVLALLGLAAAGGLYVAIVAVCHRKEQVKLLFCRNAIEKRAALERGEQSEEMSGYEPSGRLWGPFLWSAVIVAVGEILRGVLTL